MLTSEQIKSKILNSGKSDSTIGRATELSDKTIFRIRHGKETISERTRRILTNYFENKEQNNDSRNEN